MSQEIITIIMGALPVLEIRGAIPLGVLEFGFPVRKAFLLGALGNMLPIIPVLFFLKKFSDFLMRKWYFFNRLMTWLFERFQKQHKNHFDSWEWSFFALFIFVAIPLPFTGAWSGMLASHILGIPFWRSVVAIFIGIITSGFIVSAILSAGILGFRTIF